MLALLGVASSALTRLPLLEQPGWELATALGLLMALYGHAGAWVLTREAERLELRIEPLELALWATALSLLACVPPVLTAVLGTALSTVCNPTEGIGFVLVSVPSAAFLSACTGGLTARLFTRFDKAWLAHLGLVFAVTLRAVLPLLTGPQVFAFHPFVGHFPGPLYDDVVPFTPAVVWSAALAVGLGLLAVALTEPAPRRFGSRALGLAALLFVLGIRLNAGALGLETTVADLDGALGGKRETAHFRLHFPREAGVEEIERTAGDLEFRHAQLSAFLGTTPEGKVDAFLYRSDAEKKRWVGAAETDFAKPWLRQFHVRLGGFPVPVAKHELAHVLAAEWGVPPFGVTARFGGIWPIPALVEGLATAADDPVDEQTLQGWAVALRRSGKAPGLRQLVGPFGFFAAAPGRAYTVVGAFLQHLRTHYGPAKLRAVYARGEFEQVYGMPLEQLIATWEAELDGAPVDERTVEASHRRYAEASLFERSCPRERARLSEALGSTSAADAEASDALLSALERLSPADPGHALARAERLRERGADAEARKLVEPLLDDERVDGSDKARAALFLLPGALPERRRELLQPLLDAPEPSLRRAAELRLAADGPLAAVLDRYLEEPGLATALALAPHLDQPPVRYLLARRLLDGGDTAGALALLDPATLDALAAHPGLPGAAREAGRMVARAACLAGACEQVRWPYPGLAPAPADAAWVRDWAARCAFRRDGRIPVDGAGGSTE